MTDDDFEDLLDQVVYFYPLRAEDPFAKAEYDKAVATVVNTGGEEQRARLEEQLEEMGAAPIDPDEYNPLVSEDETDPVSEDEEDSELEPDD